MSKAKKLGILLVQSTLAVGLMAPTVSLANSPQDSHLVGRQNGVTAGEYSEYHHHHHHHHDHDKYEDRHEKNEERNEEREKRHEEREKRHEEEREKRKEMMEKRKEMMEKRKAMHEQPATTAPSAAPAAQ